MRSSRAKLWGELIDEATTLLVTGYLLHQHLRRSPRDGRTQPHFLLAVGEQRQTGTETHHDGYPLLQYGDFS